MSRNRSVGTTAETAFVNLLRRSGWPTAERRTLTGRFDRGDVNCGNPTLCFEVKGGKIPRIPEFLRQTEVERINSGARWGWLILKALGVGYPNADKWWAICTKDQWDEFNQTYLQQLGGTAVEFLRTSVKKHSIRQAMMQAQATRTERLALDNIEDEGQFRWYTGVWFTGWGSNPDYFVLTVGDLLDMLGRCNLTTAEVGIDA